MVKMDILVGGEPVDALSPSSFTATSLTTAASALVAQNEASSSPARCSRSPSRRPSAAKIVARETVTAIRKNVLAKCYGGDISRKKKLLNKQKEGKKRMKRIGQVDIPQEAFLAVLKIGE